MEFNRHNNIKTHVILAVYSVGFLIGTYTHLHNILVNGFLSISSRAPVWINIYWDSLTFFDFLASLLVWFKLKQGLRIAIAIMATDIIINTYSYLSGWFGAISTSMVPVALLMQCVFGTYVFTTASLLLTESTSRE